MTRSESSHLEQSFFSVVLKPVRVLSLPSGSVFRESDASIGGNVRTSGKSLIRQQRSLSLGRDDVRGLGVPWRQPGTVRGVIVDRSLSRRRS
jgi:hypothetical protein